MVRVLHQNSGGATDGELNIVFMVKMKDKLTPIRLKKWVYLTVSGLLEARVGGNQANVGNSYLMRDIVCCQGNRTVVHWGLYMVGGKCEPRVIKPYVMLPSVYVSWHILNKDILHVWDLPVDMLTQMNE